MCRRLVLGLLLAVVMGSGFGCDGTHEKGKRKDLDMPKPAENKEKEK
jgi:hypothetical protein